jgi:hypothetical protein
MANENFTTWTETDPDSAIVITSSTIAITSLNGTDSQGHITKDKGAGFYSGDFHFHYGPINFSAASSNNSRVVILDVAMGVLTDGTTITNGAATLVRWNNTATNPTLYLSYFNSSALQENAPTSEQSYQGTGVGLNINFYLDFSRTGTVVSLKIYSDSGYTSQVGSTLSVTDGGQAYRYVDALAKWDIGTGATVSGTLQNLDLSVGSGGNRSKLLSMINNQAGF